MKVINVVGARPNFMKIAPIIRAIKSFNHTNQRNLSRLPCLPRETVLLFHWGNAVYRACPVAKSYGACPVAKAYGVKCDLPCGVRKLLHGEPFSLGPNKPNKPDKTHRPPWLS